MITNQANQAKTGSFNNNQKPADAWARIRVVQLDKDGNPAVDAQGNVITHWLRADIPFDGVNPATKGIIALAKADPSKQFQCVMTVNVPDPEARANEEPILDF